MAMTLSHYGYKVLRPTAENVSTNVRNMTTSSPLIVDLNRTSVEPQTLGIEARIDLNLGSSGVVIRSSNSENAEKAIEYARCLVAFESELDWKNEWARFEHLINSRVDVLTQSPDVSKIQEGMAYKLFSTLVQYGPKYRGMREVILDSKSLEATARVCCRSTEEDGSFFMSPYLIDNLCHISGFVMNGNDTTDANDVYLSHGWESMRLCNQLALGETYQVYVKMQPLPGSKMMARCICSSRQENCRSIRTVPIPKGSMLFAGYLATFAADTRQSNTFAAAFSEARISHSTGFIYILQKT